MPGEKPSVSIILPVHNRQVLVRRAIESVLAQTMEDFELIVVDDCSTDRTAEVIGEYGADPRVRLHRSQTNLGPAGARNRGIAEARGTYIAFQDSDDRWFPEKLELQLAELQRQPDCRVCYCGALYYSRDQYYYIPISGTITESTGNLSETILSSNPTTPQTLIIEKALLGEVGMFDERLRINEDWDLAIRIAQQARFAFVEEPLAVIYRTAGSVSSDRQADMAFREQLLHDYAGLYERHPAARGRQHYIIGSQNLKHGAHGRAAAHFRASFRDTPTLRCLAQILRAHLLRLVRAGRAGRAG